MQEQKASHTVLSHARANLWLLVLSIGILCVLYPAVVWVIGQVVFHHQAQGSLIDANGDPTSDPSKAVGSKLIAQSFNSPWFFQSRPSAASYNAASSSGSNLAASSPKLRGRVAQLLGTIAVYRKDGPRHGDPVGPDVEKWFQEQAAAKRDVVTEWVNANPTLAAVWATSSDAIKGYVNQWAADHPDVKAGWKKDNADVKKDPGPDDLVVYFFKSYVTEHAGAWPVQVQETDKDGKTQTVVKPDDKGADVQSMFFDMWLTEQVQTKRLDPLKDFEQVPADLVTTSGSGLDPDISLKNARYQEDGVVGANVDKIVADYEKATKTPLTDEQKARAKARIGPEVKKVVDGLLDELASRPMFGLTGDDPLVNVLQLNLRLQAEAAKIKAQ